MPPCGICRAPHATRVITVTDTAGKVHSVYACVLCADAFHFGRRLKQG